MATYNASQIAAVASQAGFSGNALPIAVAIARAESKGDTNAYNPETAAGTPIGSGSRGLWQIYGKAHPTYNNDTLYNPLINARAAYAISSSGTNWKPWSTYNNGAYRAYLGSVTGPIVLPTTGGPGGKPWYTFPRVDNLGGVEPFGGFPKPDSNIQIPDGYPVTALLPGVVTGIDKVSAWGASITIRLNTPLNALATHTAYLHLRGDIRVRVGQTVNTGSLLAYNGGSQAAGSQKVPLGFALYAGDNYGSGSAWALMTKGNLQGPLNPVPLLNAAASGKLGLPILGGTPGTLSYTASTGNIPSYTPLLSQVHETLVDTPGFYGIALALDEAESFPGYIDLSQPGTADILGTSVTWPDIPGVVRSIGATATDNLTPFAIRSGLALIGLILVIALLVKPLSGASSLVPNAADAIAGEELVA